MSARKRLPWAAPVLCGLMAVILCGSGGCGSRETGAIESVVNRDIVNFQEFAVNASSVGLSTQASGTVFVRGDSAEQEDITVRIVMDITIDPADWGGVGIHFPEGWRVTAVDSSLVEINPPYYLDMAGTFTSGQPEKGGNSWVSIGYPLTRPGDTPGDLSGSVVIDAAFVWEGNPVPELLELNIGVGSKDGNIVNPVSLDVPVPLLEDYRPVRAD